MIFASGNPFVMAWVDSDFVGQCIFVGLIFLSVLSWALLLQKWWLYYRVQQASLLFKKAFFEHKQSCLEVSFAHVADVPNAFYVIYTVIREKALEMLDKNKAQELSVADVALLEKYAATTTSALTSYLDKNLYILSTIVTLAPFLGLLGTVYGILITFSGMGGEAGLGSNQHILGGLSLALTTTVLGLVNAIPALVGYNYLKHVIADFDQHMERFSTEVISRIAIQYKQEG